MSAMDSNQFQRIAKALADPRRFEILQVIAAGSEMCWAALWLNASQLLRRPVSHHLKELTDAGLIETRQEGQFKLLKRAARSAC
ncbi:MAG: hypothetical protein WKF84_12015 [Pyrinomonadaceae bacterium]